MKETEIKNQMKGENEIQNFRDLITRQLRYKN